MKTRICVIACAAMAGASALAANVTVYSNNIGGDAFVNVSTSDQGEAVGVTGWYYNNVRNTGLAGINSTFARSGNGSVSFVTSFGPGGNSSKADIELLAGGVNLGGNYYASSSFGRLGDLTSLSYDWYRAGVSENDAGQHAVVRILVDADGDLSTINDRGGLVFERAYNGGGAVPTDTWVTEDIFAYGANGANMWSFGAGMANWELGYGIDVSEWQAGAGTIGGDSLVIGFSMGVGSGWAASLGAIDNFTFGFGGSSTTYNFETAGGQVIPSPLAGVMGAAGLLGVAGVRRRR